MEGLDNKEITGAEMEQAGEQVGDGQAGGEQIAGEQIAGEQIEMPSVDGNAFMAGREAIDEKLRQEETKTAYLKQDSSNSLLLPAYLVDLSKCGILDRNVVSSLKMLVEVRDDLIEIEDVTHVYLKNSEGMIVYIGKSSGSLLYKVLPTYMDEVLKDRCLIYYMGEKDKGFKRLSIQELKGVRLDL